MTDDAQITCIDFNPFSPNILAVSTIDGAIKLWDINDLSKPLDSFNFASYCFMFDWNKVKKNLILMLHQDETVQIIDIESKKAKKVALYKSSPSVIGRWHPTKVL